MQTMKEWVENKKVKLKEYINSLPDKLKLGIIQVGNNPASNSYIKGKIKDCNELGIEAIYYHLDENISEQELLDLVNKLNKDETLTGFICQLPLPKHISEEKVIEAISPEKDVDGFSKLSYVFPATPYGIVKFLEEQNFEFTNKNAVVLGRSVIVGKPLAKLLLAKNCNVTVLHSKTSEENKRYFLKNADLICSAVGKRNIIDLSYELKPSAVVIDIGMNRNDEGKICGDIEDNLNVAFRNINPGSSGLVTRLALILNLTELYKIKLQK